MAMRMGLPEIEEEGFVVPIAALMAAFTAVVAAVAAVTAADNRASLSNVQCGKRATRMARDRRADSFKHRTIIFVLFGANETECVTRQPSSQPLSSRGRNR
jgi:hypothetical protein